jgi:cyclophilin family peptidyl-prolyl cis-trans isomerase
MRVCIRLATMLVMFWAAAVSMAEDKATPAADAKAPATPVAKDAPAPAAAGVKTAQFNKQYADWKVLLGQLRKLRDDYAAAPPTKQPEIEKQFKELIAKGDAKLPDLLEAGKGALQESSANNELAEFLQAMAIYQAQSENYESALDLADLLIEKGGKDPALYSAAGIAAFCVGDLDKAEKYLDKGKIANNLGKDFGELAPRFQSELDYYRKEWPKELKIRQTEAKADDLPRVILKTNRGEIELELFENQAPNTVANFISLVEKGFYDGVPFHRVLPYFMAQGGDPKGDGSGGPGYTIADECHKPDHRLHFRGTLSMAKTAAPDSGGSQFFLCFLPAKMLDGGYTAFGRVVKGLDVLAKIQRRDPEKQTSIEPDKILEAKVLRKRKHPYQPKTAAEK